MALNPKQRAFVNEYLKDRHGTNAAIRAGYSPNGAAVQAHRLLNHAKVAAEIARREAKQAQSVDITKEGQLRFLKGIQDATLPDLAQWDGEDLTVEDFKKLTPAQRSAIESVKVKRFTDKDGNTTTTIEFKMKDSIEAAKEINRMLGFHTNIGPLDGDGFSLTITARRTPVDGESAT